MQEDRFASYGKTLYDAFFGKAILPYRTFLRVLSRHVTALVKSVVKAIVALLIIDKLKILCYKGRKDRP